MVRMWRKRRAIAVAFSKCLSPLFYPASLSLSLAVRSVSPFSLAGAATAPWPVPARKFRNSRVGGRGTVARGAQAARA